MPGLRRSNDGLWDWDIDADDVCYSRALLPDPRGQPGTLSNRPEDMLAYLHPYRRDAYRQRLVEHLGATLTISSWNCASVCPTGACTAGC